MATTGFSEPGTVALDTGDPLKGINGLREQEAYLALTFSVIHRWPQVNYKFSLSLSRAQLGSIETRETHNGAIPRDFGWRIGEKERSFNSTMSIPLRVAGD
jgi:hypothetical protein